MQRNQEPGTAIQTWRFGSAAASNQPSEFSLLSNISFDGVISLLGLTRGLLSHIRVWGLLSNMGFCNHLAGFWGLLANLTASSFKGLGFVH